MDRTMANWILVFADHNALAQVITQRTMQFLPTQARRVQQLAVGDEAFLYTTRGAYRNPSLDRSRLVGHVTLTSPVRTSDQENFISGREASHFASISLNRLAAFRSGIDFRLLVEQLDLTRNRLHWGQMLRQSPVAISIADAVLLARGLRTSYSDIDLASHIESWQTATKGAQRRGRK